MCGLHQHMFISIAPHKMCPSRLAPKLLLFFKSKDNLDNNGVSANLLQDVCNLIPHYCSLQIMK